MLYCGCNDRLAQTRMTNGRAIDDELKDELLIRL
jgi:hypothetical protein